MLREQVIFLHSSFRSSSTWFWERFRADENVYAFYEPLHERLSTMTKAEALSESAASYIPGHPEGQPYFLEFEKLISQRGGVDRYSPEFAFDRFVPEDGLNGSLSAKEIAYFQGLIDYAHSCGKMPVFGCTRSLGRVGSFKAQFGGVHILVHRPLLDQWLSYRSIYETDPYFIFTISKILKENADKDKLLASIAEKTISDTGDIFGFGNLQSCLVAFLALHLYLISQARDLCCIEVDIGCIASDRNKRTEVERGIERLTGLQISLKDVQRKAYLTESYIAEMTEDSVAQAIALFSGYPKIRERSEPLVDGFTRELSLARMGSRQWSEKQLRFENEIASLNYEKDQLADHNTSLNKELRAITHENKQLIDYSASLRKEISAIRDSSSWRLTRPFRAVAKSLRASVGR